MTVPEAYAALEAAARELDAHADDSHAGESERLWLAIIEIHDALAAIDAARAAEAGKCPTCGGGGNDWSEIDTGVRLPCRDCGGTGKEKPPPDDPPLILCSGEPDCECSGCKLGTGRAKDINQPKEV